MLRIPSERLPWCTLFSEVDNGWKMSRGHGPWNDSEGRKRRVRKLMPSGKRRKILLGELAHVDPVRLQF